MGRNDDHSGGGFGPFDRFQYFPSVQLRHEQICDDEIEVLAFDGLDRLASILDRDDIVPFLG